MVIFLAVLLDEEMFRCIFSDGMRKNDRLVLKPKTNILAVIFIILFAIAFIAGIALLAFGQERYALKNGVILYSVKNVEQLKERLAIYDYYKSYPFGVEPYLLKSLPKDFAKLPAAERKKLFIKVMLPIALTVKQQFDREHALFEKIKAKIDSHKELTFVEKELLEYGYKRYRCKTINELVKKSGSVPISLLIAQAGIESGWGSSRFAIYYNNIYGIHKKHPKPNDIVRRFKSLYDATVCYVLNLDRSAAYKRFREARYRMGDYPNPYKLAEYLTMYSTKRKEYTKLIQQIIASNDLTAFDKLSPAGVVAETSAGSYSLQ
ncbi:glucosaminidase domain-containing protein [Hippea alviniae]|uniref:glucosaminidase domain-containing protein n=1 Tax=Hippea alviniae TaxID=1279027 RepID=UPI000421A48A|nr:glucosaminidase domain-containing protein [Hippea alviniae]